MAMIPASIDPSDVPVTIDGEYSVIDNQLFLEGQITGGCANVDNNYFSTKCIIDAHEYQSSPLFNNSDEIVICNECGDIIRKLPNKNEQE